MRDLSDIFAMDSEWLMLEDSLSYDAGDVVRVDNLHFLRFSRVLYVDFGPCCSIMYSEGGGIRYISAIPFSYLDDKMKFKVKMTGRVDDFEREIWLAWLNEDFECYFSMIDQLRSWNPFVSFYAKIKYRKVLTSNNRQWYNYI